MTSRHVSTHSSQMNTFGPAMSFSTSFSSLLQNEHRKLLPARSRRAGSRRYTHQKPLTNPTAAKMYDGTHEMSAYDSEIVSLLSYTLVTRLIGVVGATTVRRTPGSPKTSHAVSIASPTIKTIREI